MMAATLTVIWWRDIPAQVIAKDRRQAHKVVLHPRFQVAIDRAAMVAGKRAASDYIEEWRREARSCSDDLESEANGEAARLEREYPRDRLKMLVDAGGVDPGRATAPTSEPDPRTGLDAGHGAAGVPTAEGDA